jgi:hypothetical protein
MGFYRSFEQARYFGRQYSAKNSSFSEMNNGDGDNNIKKSGSVWKAHPSINVFHITSCELSSAILWNVRETNSTAPTERISFEPSAATEAAETSSAIKLIAHQALTFLISESQHQFDKQPTDPTDCAIEPKPPTQRFPFEPSAATEAAETSSAIKIIVHQALTFLISESQPQFDRLPTDSTDCAIEPKPPTQRFPFEPSAATEAAETSSAIKIIVHQALTFPISVSQPLFELCDHCPFFDAADHKPPTDPPYSTAETKPPTEPPDPENSTKAPWAVCFLHIDHGVNSSGA